MPGSKAKIGFSIDSIVGDEVSKSSTTATKDRNYDFRCVNDYQTEIARALRLSSDSFNADGHMKFRPDLNGTNKDVRHLFGYAVKRESSLSPSAPYATQTVLPSDENLSAMRKSPRSPSPNPVANAITNNNNTSSNNNNNNSNSSSNNNNLHTSGSNTNNNEPPVVPPLAFTVSLNKKMKQYETIAKHILYPFSLCLFLAL